MRGDGVAERNRLETDHEAWMRWGPYLAERAWGTVREDYSANGAAWDYLPHDHARSRAYRWNEDGMAGICDADQRLCLALALWNGRDPILKERMFGLTNGEGRHGEDAKEYWWYADALPSHAYLKWQYAYPLDGYPYSAVLVGDDSRSRDDPEFELLDTGVFDPEPGGIDGSARWADVTVEYAKASVDDIVMRVRVENRSARPATVHVLPTLWFRNTWSWGPNGVRGAIRVEDGLMVARHPDLGAMLMAASAGPDGVAPRPLFCENETNLRRLFGVTSGTPWPKDGINDRVVAGAHTVNPALVGTKAALWYRFDLAGRAAGEVVVRLLAGGDGGIGGPAPDTGDGARAVLEARRAEADHYHASLLPPTATDAERAVHRQAIAGLIWAKCYYFYDVERWLEGDPTSPPPPRERLEGRNRDWRHLKNWDVLSMPDPWEYPWYAAWDLAFHTVALAHVDPRFAKGQLLHLLREWYMHPNGQLPAYEWAFGDVNPPVHAWAALRVFEIDGGRDYDFLERVLHKLLLNFTWWVNRKDAEGNNLFEGGFLGMDNVGPFDRNQAPAGSRLEQADGTAWMAMYCLDLLQICLRLGAEHDPVYSDLAIKFLEHFATIARALRDSPLWNDEDGFYYDILTRNGAVTQLRVQSMVGLLPVFAVRVADAESLERAGAFGRHLRWFLEHRRDDARLISADAEASRPAGRDGNHLLSIFDVDTLQRVLARVFDEAQFLAPTGVRSLSKVHRDRPFGSDQGRVGYEPGESRTDAFGGNSNWRGPVWFPVNHLLVEALRRYDAWTGESVTVEVPAGSGRRLRLADAADELTRRLVSTFLPAEDGARPFARPDWQRMPAAWRDRILFHEYFHADTGAGLGAGHQTGWTALVVDHIATLAARRGQPR